MKTCSTCGRTAAVSEFRPKRGQCLRCYYKVVTKWHVDNRVHRRQWYADTKEKQNVGRRKNYAVSGQKNRDAAYRLAHPEKVKIWEKNRSKKPARLAQKLKNRADRMAMTGKCSAQQLRARLAFYGYRCAYCGGPFEHVDHVIPVARGGTNWPANLRPACRKCNQRKNSKKLSEWAKPSSEK